MKTVTGLVAMLAALGIGLATWSSTGAERAEPVGSRLATLHRHDPLTQSISLRTGRPGHVFSANNAFGENSVCNNGSDLDFGNYREGYFSVGIEGGREGIIVDLGSAAELAERYGYQETVGAGQGYASIRLAKDRFVIRTNELGTGQPMRESRILSHKPDPKMGSAPVELGHIYLVRLVDRHEPKFERIAKLQVVSHLPGDSVTIRWDLLRDEGGRRGR